MLKGECGNNFPVPGFSDGRMRGEASPACIRVLVVDPVIGSRFSLAQAASKPGFRIDACATVEEAHSRLACARFDLVVADQDLMGTTGIDFLSGLRASHPDVARGLVAFEVGLEFKREAIERAGLTFLLGKPVRSALFRRLLGELFGGDAEVVDGMPLESWGRFEAAPRQLAAQANLEREYRALSEPTRHHEVLLRGLLAGLNSCETEAEVFELLHGELVDAFHISRWIWVDETNHCFSQIEGDGPLDLMKPIEALAAPDHQRLLIARRSLRVARLSDDSLDLGAAAQTESVIENARTTSCCVSLAIRLSGQRTMTSLIWAERDRTTAFASVLRELQVGLQMAFQRIREATSRADAARTLAERVSRELRTPVGALTHAIDRLRGEAERAGLSTKWVDRISTESERVARAVAHLEGEMLTEPSPPSLTAS